MTSSGQGIDVLTAIQQQSTFEQNRMLDLAAEAARRKCESLRLYEPMPHQEALHASRIRRLVMRKGNRVGGTLAGAVELARAVTGQDPHDKYPLADGKAVCLGYGEGHIGRVFYPMLFRAGAFEIIRDLETNEWRAYRPWPTEKGGDLDREKEKKPAPPLIPKRFIKSMAWVKKSEKIFSLVTFTTGWELYAFNSNGDPSQAQGFSANLYWIDEDLAQSGWLEEILGRVTTTRGLIRWTALPHGDNDEMLQIVEDAERQRDEGADTPTAVVIQASIFDNKYISDESRNESIAGWRAAGEEVYNKRVHGHLSLDSIKMYPQFSRYLHAAIRGTPDNVEESATPVQRVVTERSGEPPDDWTRYLFVDPGRQVCAVLFVAVPPPELGDQIVVYDECYIKQATAKSFGDAIEPKIREKVFQAFYIDAHGAALTEIGSGVTPLERYQQELKLRNIRCEATGHVFRAAVDSVKGREECLTTLLGLNRDGHPGVLVVMEKCPNLRNEIEKFKKKTVRKGGQVIPLDEGDRRANTHAVECLEYAAAAQLTWVKPRSRAVSFDPVSRFRDWIAERRERIAARGQSGEKRGINLGPIGSSQ